MSTNKKSIRVESYIHIGDNVVNYSQLSKEQREYVAAQLNYIAVNAALTGKAEIHMPELPEKNDIFPK